jgi:hypothetical protein
MATFSNYVFDASTQTPPPLNVSLSGSSNSVILRSSGTLSGKAVAGLLYNEISTATTATTSLSVAVGTVFSVHPKYNGSTFALYFTDCSTCLFTVNTAYGTDIVQSVAGSVINFENRGPREVRRFAIEG